jgi:hypothetical protein
MQKSKLILLLKKFTKEEMKEFEKFISSPYFLKGRNLKPAFIFIKKFYPGFGSDKFSEENFYKKLYPGNKYDRTKSAHIIHVLFSELTMLAEKFLVYNGFENGRFYYQYNTCLAESYREKDLLEPVLKFFKKNSELINSDEDKSDFYIRHLETNMSIAGIYYTLNKQKESFRFSQENLLYIYAFIFDIMNKYINEYFVNRYSYNIEYKGFELIKKFTEAFDPVLFNKECDEDEHETKNLVLINYYIIKSRLDEDDKESLMSAMEIYAKIFGKLSRFTQWYNYALLFNRLFGRIRFDRFYLNKANELIDYVWGRGIFSTHKKINLHLGSYHTAMTVKAAVLNSKDFREFIMQYSDKVDPVYIKDIRDYSFAFFYFKDNRFEECLKILSQKDSLGTPSIKINKHKLKICCLYELGHLVEAISAIDSFEHFLRNNKNVSEIVKTENLKFVSSLKKLIRIRLGEINDPDMELTKIIELNKNSVFGYWFEEKFKQMKK